MLVSGAGRQPLMHCEVLRAYLEIRIETCLGLIAPCWTLIANTEPESLSEGYRGHSQGN